VKKFEAQSDGKQRDIFRSLKLGYNKEQAQAQLLRDENDSHAKIQKA